MQYLFLAYADQSQRAMNSTSERAAFDRACLANDDALRESGYLLAAAHLAKDGAAATVQFQNDQLSLTGDLFNETKEQLAALFFINARDLNEAVRIASKMPQARQGPIEVRSLMDMS